MNAECPIWRTPAEYSLDSNNRKIWNSPRAGGKYEISGSAAAELYAKIPTDFSLCIKLTEWIYQRNRDGITPVISSNVFPEIKTLVLPTVREQLMRLMGFILTKSFGEQLEVYKGCLLSGTPEEINYLTMLYLVCSPFESGDDDKALERLARYINYLHHESWIIRSNDKDDVWLIEPTIKGGIEFEKEQGVVKAGEQGFVAMWFDASMNDAYEQGIQTAITDAGYKPVRIDKEHHNNKIDDQIIAEIRRSKFLVADFTGHRGGVYFESGFAMGLGIPVIWCCRKDDFDNLHFDTNHYNHIEWENHQELKKKLTDRIVATIGEGPRKQTR